VADICSKSTGKRRAPTRPETAQAAALVIKKNYPIVQVSVYDSLNNSNTLVEAPAASS
jgi:hypothetical protein